MYNGRIYFELEVKGMRHVCPPQIKQSINQSFREEIMNLIGSNKTSATEKDGQDVCLGGYKYSDALPLENGGSDWKTPVPRPAGNWILN